MKLVVDKTMKISGTVTAPPSKSHTHRAIIIASLADGTSNISNQSDCDDCLATIEACKKFGAKFDGNNITGVDGKPLCSDVNIDVRGSGTTMRFMTAVFSLCKGSTTLSGDESIRSRPIGPLLTSLADLGVKRARGMNGCPPVSITGKMTGGRTVIEGQSSQYLSALLLSCPLAKNDSMIEARAMVSQPYIGMTLEHMERCGVKVFRNSDKYFIPGGQSYRARDYSVPGDFSAAAFLMAAAKITGSEIEILGLDPEDSQGDRAIIGILETLGSGNCIDLRDMPDLFPILAVLACQADGETKLINVGHARQKESDRITAISIELGKMGADIEETPEGLIIRHSELAGAVLESHGDHRIAMALAVAGLIAEGRTIINGADSISKSYPGFISDLRGLGANVRAVEG